MYAQPMRRKPMTEDQLEQIEKEIIKIYLHLITRTSYDPQVIEHMKLSSLSDVHGRYKAGEPW